MSVRAVFRNRAVDVHVESERLRLHDFISTKSVKKTMALLLMPLQTAALNQLPPSLSAHGTAISNTIRQVAGAVGTSLLVTIMMDRTKAHVTDMMAGGMTGLSKEQMMLEASIQGINDSYVVIIGFAAIALLLSFFITRKTQVSEVKAVASTVTES